MLFIEWLFIPIQQENISDSQSYIEWYSNQYSGQLNQKNKLGKYIL